MPSTPILTPGGYAQNSSSQYNGILVSAADIFKPSADPVVKKRFGNQRFLDLAEIFGMTQTISQISHEWWEEDRIMRKIVATTAGGGSAGAAATFTIASTPIPQSFVITQSYPYTLDNSQSFIGGFTANKNDTILIPASSGANAGNMVMAKIVSTNPQTGQFTAVPLVSTATIPALVSATQITVSGSANPEKSVDPNPEDYRLNKYSNTMQKLRRYYELTDTSRNVQTWVGAEGQQYWWYEGEAKTFIKFLNECDMTALVSQQATNTLASDPTNPTLTTNGLIPQLLADGFTMNYNLNQGFTVANFDTLVKGINANKGAKEQMMLCGIDFALSVDNNLSDYLKAGSITYGAFEGMQDKMISLEFDTLRKGNYLFHKKTLDTFSDYQTLGAPGMPYRYESMIIPMTKSTNGFAVEVIYQANNNNRRRVFDGFTQSPDGKDVTGVSYLTSMLVKCSAAGQGGYILAS